ncbi:putative secreted lyase [[Actinomadura] parvosata subsp. kistnae]|uniref:Lyase n=1 Tax=[Actinomadura] parvosata subsp. kistnae TaxID=1909395 RepID=A0A1V0ACM0_9ACTN|nr:polysaccharide lyase 8 family protein [Nonomuraea sp. ATCC 55076]AQZ67968.1 lyase [Nonomuraea sp. ATCC 55076]SPL93671.1 putative secreted lyase [Actinomadura parvosata subsp. kistnae]
MRLPSRRLFLRLGGVTAAGTMGALAPAAAAHTPDDTFVRLRRRWREVTAGPGHDSEGYHARLAALARAAGRYRATMAPGPSSLWPDQPFPSFVATPRRLRVMAQAYALGLGDATLAEAVAEGVEHYRRHVYAAGGDAPGNWWHWQIGVPKALLDASVLTGTGSAALAEAVDHYVPERRLRRYEGNSTAANRVDLCVVTLLRAMLDDDHARARLAVSALSPVFATVSEGDGFYRDGSFIQHSYVPYQGAYGVTLLSGLATLYAVLRGSPWELADQRIFDTVERSFAPFVHDGACMDLVRGRSVGRRPFGDHERGREIAAAVLLLGESAPAGTRARWRAMVKGWAERGTSRPMLEHAAEPAFHARLAALLADGAVPAAAEPVGHRLLPMSARAVHRRPGWCAALSMASHRIGHYEHGNGENLRGWHTGSGMLYWWAGGHGDQYSDAFWPTVDPYRLPGTTVSTRRLPDGAGAAWGDTRTPWRWVGGATDGTYAAVGQHLSGLESTLEAFKSWFFLDDLIVCLGAGITCADGVPVETVVDNRRTAARLDTGDGWAHLEGHGGYVLPGQPLRTLRERRTGGGVSRDYVTLWLDHGVDPRAASYAYLLLPGASKQDTRARAAALTTPGPDGAPVRVLANTAGLQAVHVPALGLTAACFWSAGTAGGLTASAPCAALVRERPDGTATVTVADPRCDLDELTLTWAMPVAELLDGDALLSGGRLTFERPADREGASLTVTVRLGRG